jgi:hypothetical protein
MFQGKLFFVRGAKLCVLAEEILDNVKTQQEPNKKKLYWLFQSSIFQIRSAQSVACRLHVGGNTVLGCLWKHFK